MSELPPLPESIAGHFVGVHAGRLVVAVALTGRRRSGMVVRNAGPRRPTTLGPGESAWRRSGEQAEPLAYGGAVSTLPEWL